MLENRSREHNAVTMLCKRIRRRDQKSTKNQH